MKTIVVIMLMGLALAAFSTPASEGDSGYGRWKNGPPADKTYFPIAVWLQDPHNAAKYQAAGINLFIGLWQGPTEDQLAALKAAKMPVVCAQNEVGLKHKDDPIIVGWMHGDEPDNAQELPSKKGYGPPILPEKIIEDYNKLKSTDPTRPIILNLGQGVAWDGWYGRGVRTNKPEDYAEYIKGCDLVSFDIYPVAHDHKEVTGKLWMVANGVERLCKWSNNEKFVWDCIECTHIGTPEKKATPHQVKAEVWMSLIHGSKGLIYFVHEFKPKFNEHALLNDPDMLAGVTAVNKQIQDLAPALNSATIKDGVNVTSSASEVPIAAMTKKCDGATYVFAVGMRDGATKATFQLASKSGAKAEVLGEKRTVNISDGKFEDDFKAYDVHLYKITE